MYWDWALEFGIGIGHWGLRLGIGIGDRYWRFEIGIGDWGLGLRIRDWD